MRSQRTLIELAVVILGSAGAGFLVGTIQHFVSFGVWGYGFGWGALNLARFEGGIVGAALGPPTGLLAYYPILRRHVTPKGVVTIILGALIAGCALGIALFWVSAFVTPIITVAIAYWVGRRVPTRRPASAGA